MEKITSKNNPLITETSKLKALKYRKLTQSFLMEGEKLIEAALLSGTQITTIFFGEDKEKSFSHILKKADDREIKTVSISAQAAAKLASGKSTQGIFAVGKIKNYPMAEAQGTLIIALEDLSDPGNMGTIIRTADAVGAGSLILSAGCSDIYNEKVLRASMGSVFNVNAIISKDFIKDIKALKEKGYNLACGHLEGEDFFARQKHEKTVLIIGNEARGISEGAAGICQSRWKLPMPGGAESLNAAVAAGIMMYDIMRKR